MKVKELIKELKKYNQEDKVYMSEDLQWGGLFTIGLEEFTYKRFKGVLISGKRMVGIE